MSSDMHMSVRVIGRVLAYVVVVENITNNHVSGIV